jgi:hypothetical protein
MEVGYKALGLRDKFDDLVGKQVGLDGRDAEARNAFYLV